MQQSMTIPTSADYKQWYDKEFYVDKTYIMSVLKNSFVSWAALFFARPRRWWKTLFMNTMQYFFDKEMYKEEYFKDKLIWKDKEMKKKTGKYMTLFLDLKPVYDMEKWELKLDNLYRWLIGQIKDKYFVELIKEMYWNEAKIDNLWIKQKNEYIKENYENIWDFIKAFVEKFSKEEEIIIFIDEYDKPVNDCLKTKKNEQICKEILNKLKNNLFSHLKDIPAIIIVTWVNKLSMASFFSDFNNIDDNSQKVNVWFTQEEVKNLFNRLWVKYENKLERWYNGYYYEWQQEYNPWAIWRYIANRQYKPYWAKTWTTPDYFRYLITEKLNINSMEDFMKFLADKNIIYSDKIINIEYLNDMNPWMIAHLFYYAWLLSVDPKKNKFFIPNNDVIESYENLIFQEKYTPFYMNLKTKLVDMLETWPEEENIKDFIIFMLTNKYNNQDKTWINENIIVSDIALLMKTFSRNDIQRETNILPWRPDLIFIDKHEKNNVVEFKVARKTEQVEWKIKEAKEQLEMYKKWWEYDRCILVVIDLEKIEVEVKTI